MGPSDDGSAPDATAPIDLDAHGLGHLAGHARTATFAPNWRTVLLADAMVGVVVAAIGIAIVTWLGWPGWLIIAAGLVYVAAVARRFLQWRWLRRQVGLPA